MRRNFGKSNFRFGFLTLVCCSCFLILFKPKTDIDHNRWFDFLIDSIKQLFLESLDLRLDRHSVDGCCSQSLRQTPIVVVIDDIDSSSEHHSFHTHCHSCTVDDAVAGPSPSKATAVAEERVVILSFRTHFRRNKEHLLIQIKPT